jgi:hypothetical protein
MENSKNSLGSMTEEKETAIGISSEQRLYIDRLTSLPVSAFELLVGPLPCPPVNRAAVGFAYCGSKVPDEV